MNLYHLSYIYPSIEYVVHFLSLGGQMIPCSSIGHGQCLQFPPKFELLLKMNLEQDQMDDQHQHIENPGKTVQVEYLPIE